MIVIGLIEYDDRPTKPVGWWADGDGQKILGGRDELGGGTWMGCTRDGKVAFLTNFREPDPWSGSRSRGELPKRFLEVLHISVMVPIKPYYSCFISFSFLI